MAVDVASDEIPTSLPSAKGLPRIPWTWGPFDLLVREWDGTQARIDYDVRLRVRSGSPWGLFSGLRGSLDELRAKGFARWSEVASHLLLDELAGRGHGESAGGLSLEERVALLALLLADGD